MKISLGTGSPEQTLALGAGLAKLLRPGDVLALEGQLGAGKTVFVKGLARGLGTDPALPVTSPSFTLLHEYPGPLPLYHFDFYRLARLEDALGLGYEEYFDGDGVCAVEWADKFPGLFRQAFLWISFLSVTETGREITLAGRDQDERRTELERIAGELRADKK